MATPKHVAVIVAQAGVGTPPVVEQAREGGPATLVLNQEPGESLPAMGHRVRDSLSRLASEGLRVHRATFVARKGFGIADVLGTADLLRVLLSAMVSFGGGQVYLRGDAADARSQVALRALAEAISDQVRGTGIQIVSSTLPERPENLFSTDGPDSQLHNSLS